MKSSEFLQRIEALRKPIFTLSDAAKITGKTRAYLKVYLFRLKKRNLIKEIERGKYTVSFDPLVVASHLTFPSYISFLSAYSYYQMTTQMPKIIYVVSHKPKKTINYENYIIQFIAFSSQRFFGYKREEAGKNVIFIAEKEKVIIDSLYLPRYCPLDETFTALQDTALDTAKLIHYARRMDSLIVLKRLGYMLEKRGTDIFKEVRKEINTRYDLLNPFLKKTKIKDTKWKLIINEVL